MENLLSVASIDRIIYINNSLRKTNSLIKRGIFVDPVTALELLNSSERKVISIITHDKTYMNDQNPDTRGFMQEQYINAITKGPLTAHDETITQAYDQMIHAFVYIILDAKGLMSRSTVNATYKVNTSDKAINSQITKQLNSEFDGKSKVNLYNKIPLKTVQDRNGNNHVLFLACYIIHDL